MNSQKLENQLNLALDTPDNVRSKTDNLNVGFAPENETWELIVRYTGSLERVEALGASVTLLIDNYAIIVTPQYHVDTLARMEEIIYIEKPKRLNFVIENGKRVSCINSVQEAPFDFRDNVMQAELNLTGKGCILCVIDSGIDYAHSMFLKEDGSSRILELWDQSVSDSGFLPPAGYNMGALFTREDIDRALQAPVEERFNIVNSRDISGHGTSVAGIAASVAPLAELIIVKLDNPEENGFPSTAKLMQAIDFCVKKGMEYGRPTAINVSFGNNYGSHDGTSLLSTFIDSASNNGRNVIVIGTGNEGALAAHTSGLVQTNGRSEVPFDVGRFEKNLNLQIWKTYGDEFAFEIISPSNDKYFIDKNNRGSIDRVLGQNRILVYVGEPSPYSIYQEIYMEIIPLGEYVEEGQWSINISADRVIDGRFDMWLGGNNISLSTRFLQPAAETTLTIPSAASKAISVGAYNSLDFSYADFSGRGFTRNTNQIKPDIVAPGVDILTAVPGGGEARRTGTSFATPFVTGASALLMEWGIINGNDLYLYGEKVKAYLIKGARRFPGVSKWPDPRFGWGALCVLDSIRFMWYMSENI